MAKKRKAISPEKKKRWDAMARNRPTYKDGRKVAETKNEG